MDSLSLQLTLILSLSHSLSLFLSALAFTITKQRQQARSLPSHSLFKNSWIVYSGLILLRTMILMAVDSFLGSHIVAIFVVCLAFCVSLGHETLKHVALSNSRPYASSVKSVWRCMYLSHSYYRLWTDLCWAAVRIFAAIHRRCLTELCICLRCGLAGR